MLTALGLIGLSILGHAQDRLKQKEKQLKKAEKLMKEIEDATTIERIVIHTDNYDVIKKDLNVTSCYEFRPNKEF